MRALGAFYLRLTGKSKEIYQYLEPLLNDYRKLRVRGGGKCYICLVNSLLTFFDRWLFINLHGYFH